MLRVVFYRTATGDEPVRVWLRNLSKEDKKAIGTDILTVQKGWPVGMPVCRPLGGGLYEVRTTLRARIARVIFCFHGKDTVVLLHGFIKKSKKTPAGDLDLARGRVRSLGK
jgi:phage-related protein